MSEVIKDTLTVSDIGTLVIEATGPMVIEGRTVEPTVVDEVAVESLGDQPGVVDAFVEAVRANREPLDEALESVRGLTLSEASEHFIGGRVITEEWSEHGEIGEDAVSGYPAAVEAEDEPDEDESVDLEALGDDGVSEDIVYDVAVAAASTGRDFDGAMLAEYLEGGGEITDVRLAIALGVLRLGTKLTGDRMLHVLEGLGFADEAGAARVAREELSKVPDVPVEVMTALPASLGES